MLLPFLLHRLLAGESGVQAIDRFDASEFPTRFAAQIKNFDDEG
jgi:3-oxoacyl-[acyl-carrier-protein] synthase II